MIQADRFLETLTGHGISFFSGVPDSLLKSLCACITDKMDSSRHVIAANEGGAVGLAAGHHLATGGIGAVYMQNSGLGNTVNPLLSLTDAKVYHIPVLLIVGWRGEPGVHDEPQHVKQGEVTLPLLESMGIRHEVLSDNEDEALRQAEAACAAVAASGEAVALVVRKGTFAPYTPQAPLGASPAFPLSREAAIEAVAGALSPETMVVSTTGMASRELFELRERLGQGHERDFLTVGSMGHASQIALGIALSRPDLQVCCFDGDGAALMHMGGLAIIGSRKLANYLHIVFNNGAHDSVGGQPTVGLEADLPAVALACGYRRAASVETVEEIGEFLAQAGEGPELLEIRVRKGARKDLGRPTTTPVQNKDAFMRRMQQLGKE